MRGQAFQLLLTSGQILESADPTQFHISVARAYYNAAVTAGLPLFGLYKIRPEPPADHIES